MGSSLQNENKRLTQRTIRCLKPILNVLTSSTGTRQRRILEMVRWKRYSERRNTFPRNRQPFDILAEGLITENSRGDTTPFERRLASPRIPSKAMPHCQFRQRTKLAVEYQGTGRRFGN